MQPRLNCCCYYSTPQTTTTSTTAARLHRHFKLALGQQGQAANSGATGGLVPTHLSSVLDLMAAVMASAKEVSLSDTV